MLLTAPQFFNLAETEKGTVLVTRGKLVREDISEKYGNRQFYFMDEDKKLKGLSGGQLAYIVDQHNLADGKKEVKITYDGNVKLKSGNYAGKKAHQYIVELVNEDDFQASPSVDTPTKSQDADALE